MVRLDRPLAAWLLACAVMVAAMVVLGGVTRLTQSGLSITEWQPVIGVIPPLSPEEWQAEFAKYRAIPQFQAIHSWMTLADFKTIYFWEWLHRLWGRLIGIAFLLPLAWFAFRRRIPPELLPWCLGILVLIGLQGALGWFMVESGLARRIFVSQYRLVAHLALALVIYAAMLHAGLRLSWPDRAVLGGRAVRLRRAAAFFLALVFLTMLAGGFVAGLNAGLTYNTFPLMDGRLVPEGYLQLSPWWRNAFENVAAVQFDHRVLAMATLAGAVLLWLAGRGAVLPKRCRRSLDLVLVTALVQVGLGIATLLLVVPVPLAALHQAGALALFTAVFLARHGLRGAAWTAPLARLDESRPATL